MTAEELLDNEHPSMLESIIDGNQSYEDAKSYIKDWMIEFAKLHVEAALKEAVLAAHKEESVLNAYPLDNIK